MASLQHLTIPFCLKLLFLPLRKGVVVLTVDQCEEGQEQISLGVEPLRFYPINMCEPVAVPPCQVTPYLEEKDLMILLLGNVKRTLV